MQPLAYFRRFFGLRNPVIQKPFLQTKSATSIVSHVYRGTTRVCAVICDALGRPRGAYRNFPLPEGWKGEVTRYGRPFGAFGVHAHDVLPRLASRRLYVVPHTRAFNAGLDEGWETHLAFWCLRVQKNVGGRSPAAPLPSPDFDLTRRRGAGDG